VGPTAQVEQAVVVGVEVLTVRAGEAGHEHEGGVIGGLEGEVGRQVGGPEGEGRLGCHEEADRGDDAPGQVGDLLDDPAAAGAVAEDEVGEAGEGSAGGAGELEVLVVVGAGLVGADLAECRTPGERRGRGERGGPTPTSRLTEGA
jgi:hypothetical protein